MSTTNSVEKAKPSKKLKVVDEKILKQTYYVPKQKMQNFLERVEERTIRTRKYEYRCSTNLQELQVSRLTDNFKFDNLWSANHKQSLFMLSCHKALYAQDWNKLLYLLKKVPYWELPTAYRFYYYCLYPRLQMILLMFHPTAHETGALNDFLHMAWGCRSTSEKKAILKVLLTLQKKISIMAKYTHKKDKTNL